MPTTKEISQSILPALQNLHAHASEMRSLSDAKKQQLLHRLADLLAQQESTILTENQKDLDRMSDDNPKKDRLRLTPERIQGLSHSLHAIAQLPDPTGHILSEKRMENGLHIQKMSAPLGVVGVIYESRPNVTVDVAALCIRSGNAVVLRGGSDAAFSNQILVRLIHKALQTSDVSPDCVLLLPTDRKFVSELLTADTYVDILIPRGSQSLIDFVRQHASVPTIETGAGVCHTYVSAQASLEKAADIVVNAKTSRPSVCNALDTVLVDQSVAADFLPRILTGFQEFSVEIFADPLSHTIFSEQAYPLLSKAMPEDYGREFLSYKCSVKVVKDLQEALAHIRLYSSKHSEAIVSEDPVECETFLQSVDAAAVYANASTRFTDGGVFGLGAEIGISTQKLHARGPFALEKLVTEKWIIRGDGQIR
ncbi:MAG: glutamate-5-semialdehyde dehydrogenase [Bacteroidota bacterium]